MFGEVPPYGLHHGWIAASIKKGCVWFFALEFRWESSRVRQRCYSLSSNLSVYLSVFMRLFRIFIQIIFISFYVFSPLFLHLPFPHSCTDLPSSPYPSLPPSLPPLRALVLPFPSPSLLPSPSPIRPVPPLRREI